MTKIENQISQLPENQVEMLAEIFENPGDLEMLIHDMSFELSNDKNVSYSDNILTQNFSDAFYKMSNIQDVAIQELKNREQEHKEMLRESPEYSDAMTFIKYASNEQFVDWDWISDKIVDQSNPEIANLAIKDFKENNE